MTQKSLTLTVPKGAPAGVAPHDDRTLTLDLIAVATLFFAAVCYHLNNPLLTFETQFGNAFRNVTLQPVVAVGLAVCAAALIGLRRPVRGLNAVAAVALMAVAAYMLLAVIFGFNLSGALVGIDQAVFRARLSDATPREALAAALTWSTPLFWLAAAATVILWRPWARLAVYSRALRRQSAALIVGVVVVFWEWAIGAFQIQEFLLPRPSTIAGAFSEVYPRLISAGWNTFQNAFWGFVIGCGGGVLFGIVASRFMSFSRALLPLAIGLNAVPIIGPGPADEQLVWRA